MKQKLTILIPLLLLAALMLSACAADNSLAGTTWVLVSYGDTASPTVAAHGVETSLEFKSDGTLGGSMGCNGFGGEYAAKGDTVTFSNLISTMMACEEPRMSQETATFALMNGDVAFVVNGDTLTLTAANGQVMNLAKK